MALGNSKKKKGPKGKAHGGACPPGQIFDHNIGSPTYGKCIPVTAKKKGKNKGMKGWTA